MPRNIIVFIFLLAISNCKILYGQNIPVQVEKDKSAQGKIFGKLIDQINSNALEGATVQLSSFKINSITKKDQEIINAIVISNKKGEFYIDQIPTSGKYKLYISDQGFSPYEKMIELTLKVPTQDLGILSLNREEQTLDTVAINADKSLLKLALDKKIYNVEKDLSAVGGTAVDVMKNVPGVQVDIDGNVYLRNAGPQILVDGRPTTLTLSQIPASQIATIEIITNPSSKYSAGSGGAGIINVVLKVNKRTGYNGNVRAGIDSRLKSSLGGDLNFLQSRINLFASLNVNGFRSITSTETQRTDVSQAPPVNTQQNNKPIVNGVYAYTRAGMDYFIDSRNTLSIAGNYFRADFDAKDLIFINRDSVYSTSTTSEKSRREIAVKADFINTGSGLGFKHLFKRKGQELTADLNYNLSEYNNTSNYQSKYFDGNGNIKPYTSAERPIGGSSTHGYIAQTDYINPLSDKKKMEMGLRFDLRNYTSWNDNYIKNQGTGNYELLPDISVRYNFEDRVIAGYGIYSEHINNFSYQLGLRIESSEYAGISIKSNERFKYNYPFSFFPSVYLSQKLNDKEDIQLNYSRKVYRPVFFQLVPFVDFTDSLNIFIGNPTLKPEFTNLTEFSYTKQFKPGHSFLASAYLNFTNNIITRYQFLAANTNPNRSDSTVFNSYINADKNYVTGLELTAKNQLFKWWNLTSNLNIYNVNLVADNIEGTKNNKLTSWFAKINSSFKISKAFNFQLNADYQSKTILPPSSRSITGLLGNTQFNAQGVIKPTYGIDLSLRKSFLKNNAASLTLQWNDILRTRSYRLVSQSDFFKQEVYRLRDPQLVRLTFSWQFGKLDANIFKRRSSKTEKETLNSIQEALGH